ncbi:hypothetical protein [Pseudodesulfovibrio profundus]|uniref:hypothetical protein n=1 Tax=Pseudodesulfovibrio profundus TaxID=57320 RepID=UPI000BE456D4|nr:hypothetical protein [Pseudodesulfovibrio profundus]
MSKTTVTQSGGVGFFGLLTALFVGLKLTGHIAWSWWWVLAPIWMPLCLTVVIIAACLGFAAWSWKDRTM